jgi:hypothetical protein
MPRRVIPMFVAAVGLLLAAWVVCLFVMVDVMRLLA